MVDVGEVAQAIADSRHLVGEAAFSVRKALSVGEEATGVVAGLGADGMAAALQAIGRDMDSLSAVLAAVDVDAGEVAAGIEQFKRS